MKVNLLTLGLLGAMVLPACSVWATPLTTPEAGKYYRIRHVSGLYLTDGHFNSVIKEKAEDNSQIFQFVPVAGEEGVYNIQRMSSGMYCGSDNRWTSTAISRSIPLSQHRIAVAESDPEYVLLQNVGMNSPKNCMGTDNTTDGSAVYTDKTGSDTAKHLWVLEEAELYPSETETPVDFYADKQLPDGDPRADAYPGYKLVFAQEFSEDGAPDHEIWNFEQGFCRNQEDQYYNGDKNSYIQDGVLVIEGKYVKDEKIPNPRYDRYDKTWPSRIGKYLTWTSGSMQTKGSWDGGYTWNYGIYEVRAKVPQYVGSWPAIWSTGMQHEWPYGGEIDIMEYYGNCIHANVCWGNGGRWSGNWNSKTVHDNVLGEGWGDEYHIWRMIWDYDHMELWCDDMLVNNIDLNTTYNAIPDGDYDHGNGCNPFRDVRHMLWLNLALGGQNGGSLENTPRPLRYLIDYARVYQKIGTDGKAKYSVDEVISEPKFSLKDGEEGPTTAVEMIAEEAENNGSRVIYNMQGMRVDTPVEALRGSDQVYIVVENGESKKVIF
ncbi:MAG: glycoside hydrolase family 16 protein [Muribaculaceae bacterium]|nr:glycoside hydrolase family 16 protein [Muribaculaceae bacterium]